jgi:integrase
MFTKAKELRKFYGDKPQIELRKEWGRSIKMTAADAALIASHMKNGDAKDAFIVIRHSGPVRPGEVFAMRWEYANLEAGIYHNPRGKSQRARRVIPLLKEAVAVLVKRHAAAGMPREGLAFPAKSKTGHMMTIQKSFTKARRQAKLPEAMVLYTARHGQATDIGRVVSTKELMDMGGWSDAKTAMGYQHPDVADLQARLDAVKTSERCDVSSMTQFTSQSPNLYDRTLASDVE